MSKKRKSQRQRLRDAKTAFLKPENLHDPFCGVISVRALILSTGSNGKRHGQPRDPFWNPFDVSDPEAVQRDAEMKSRGDGFTTAHPGTITKPQETEAQRLARCAGLTAEELQVMELHIQVQPSGHHRRLHSYADIAAKLGLSFWAVERRVKSINAKLKAYSETIVAMGGAAAVVDEDGR